MVYIKGFVFLYTDKFVRNWRLRLYKFTTFWQVYQYKVLSISMPINVLY